MVYAGALALPAIVLREDAAFGLVSLVWLFAVVWSTDIAAYFCGRLVGGPKLWPRVSPNKTWAGTLGGTFFGMLAGMATLYLAGVRSALLAAPMALLASLASQGGDLFESAMKRHFGTKDSSQLIPGHGGLMDRLDGFVAAAALVLLIGLIRAPGAPRSGHAAVVSGAAAARPRPIRRAPRILSIGAPLAQVRLKGALCNTRCAARGARLGNR
ncbi:phosphatidate cytidylyltransferase [Ancylobacter dichloromethanicus]